MRRPLTTSSAAGNRTGEESVQQVVIGAPSRRSNLHIVESPSAPSTLIERAVELEVLRAAVRRLAGGGSGVVVLEAAAGLGKTALLDHAATLATEAGGLVR